MQLHGVIRKQSVVFEQDIALPEGTHVVVIPVREFHSKRKLAAEDPFLHADIWAPDVVPDAPADLAENHDFYLYGVKQAK